MTLKSKSKLCRMLKKRRMDLACVIMTIKSKRKICRMHTKSRMNVTSMWTNDLKEYEQSP